MFCRSKNPQNLRIMLYHTIIYGLPEDRKTFRDDLIYFLLHSLVSTCFIWIGTCPTWYCFVRWILYFLFTLYLAWAWLTAVFIPAALPRLLVSPGAFEADRFLMTRPLQPLGVLYTLVSSHLYLIVGCWQLFIPSEKWIFCHFEINMYNKNSPNHKNKPDEFCVFAEDLL